MSDGAKRYKGQIQTYEGSPTGESIVTNLFEYNTVGLVSILGETKIGSKENDFKWFLSKFEYDPTYNVSAIRTAINKVSSMAPTVTVDTTSNPGFTRIEAIGGDLEVVSKGDLVFLDTGSNAIHGARIIQKISDTEVLIAETATNETATSISPNDLLFSLESDLIKNYDKRRWDKRALYIYE